jgi:hypothetical protein
MVHKTGQRVNENLRDATVSIACIACIARGAR